MSAIQTGDRVQIHLDDRFGEREGWYSGVVTRIEPYSDHRWFYWVKLDAEAQARLKINEISIFNPGKIRRMDEETVRGNGQPMS